MADAVMYIDRPARRYIVALVDEGGESTPGDLFRVALLTESGGAFRPRMLPLDVENTIGRGLGRTAGGMDGEPDADARSNSGRLWGVDDVDGDGRAEIWAASLMESAKGIWDLNLTLYHPATGRSEQIDYTGAEDSPVVPDPHSITPGASRRVRDWLLTRGVLVAQSGMLHEDGWQDEKPYSDAAAAFDALTASVPAGGTLPTVEVPYNAADSSAADEVDCARDGTQFRDGFPMLWRNDLRRHVMYPIYHSGTQRDLSMVVGRRYLWIAHNGGATGDSVRVYDTRRHRMTGVRVRAPGDFTFRMRGDTLLLGGTPFHAPLEYGGEAETRGAVICGDG